jgi:hypothetical protein
MIEPWKPLFDAWRADNPDVLDDDSHKQAFRGGMLATGRVTDRENYSSILPVGEFFTAEEADLVLRGKLIACIKCIRERSGLSLMDAKRYYDAHKHTVIFND